MRSQSWDGSARAHLLSVKMPVSFAVILVITMYYHASMQTGEKRTKKESGYWTEDEESKSG